MAGNQENMLCKVCHKHKTAHSSGVCSQCRRIQKNRENQVLCSFCQTRYTKDASGICHKCRTSGAYRKQFKGTEKEAQLDKKYIPLCRICGKTRTNHESGVCSACRKTSQFRMEQKQEAKDPDKVIDTLSERLMIMEAYKNGESMQSIANRVGKSKQAVWATIQKLIYKG